MKEAKFIKKENDLAEYEIPVEEKERVFNENGEEYKAEKIEKNRDKIEEQVQEIYESAGMVKLYKENAPYVVKIIKVLEGLTTNSANQILNEVAYIIPKISKLSF